MVKIEVNTDEFNTPPIPTPTPTPPIYINNATTRGKRKPSNDSDTKSKKHPRVIRLLTSPSYSLVSGCSVNIRHENRIRLRYLLRKLVARRNWVDASGVLSVLLKGTCRERVPHNNRFKYGVAMELLRHMGNNPDNKSLKIGRLYDAWRVKVTSYKSWPLKDRYLALEYVISCIARNMINVAKEAMPSLKLNSDRARDPMMDLVIGLTYYELWYSDVLKEMHLRNVTEFWTPSDSETVGYDSTAEFDDMIGDDAASIDEAHSYLHYHSETSVVNGEAGSDSSKQNPKTKATRVYACPQVEHRQQFQSQGFYKDSAKVSETTDGSNEHPNYRVRRSSALNVHGLQSLIPFRMPFPDDLAAFFTSTKAFTSDNYKEALKYLKFALQSQPPFSEATLLPLIQLMLLGGQVDEVFHVLDKSCYESNSVFPYRLRACVEACLDSNSYETLASSFEDVMKKDPTCRHSLTKLIVLHQKGNYAPVRLLEMIALYLEATLGDDTVWKEFASCLLKISQCEEDRMSMCREGDQAENEKRHTGCFCTIPSMFVMGMSGKTWKLRCRWWLNRHFSKHVLRSELGKGDLKLMAYKAACASHLYGKDFQYVESVLECLQEHDETLLSFLRTHKNDSLGFFSNLIKK